MVKSYKYDVVFSFVEADRKCVQAIADLLKDRVKYYLYDEHQARQWGENIFMITLRIYRGSRYVVMITSKDFVNGKWARIETEVVIAHGNELSGRVLQVKIDDTPVSGLTDSVTYVDWNDNAEQIADLLISKVKSNKRSAIIKRLVALGITGVLASMAIIVYSFFVKPVNPNSPHSIIDNIPVEVEKPLQVYEGDSMALGSSVGEKKASFFISKTETTVAEYAAYCARLHKLMPPQPSPAHDENPVVNITWDEAMAYCKWRGGRLPSEREWRRAASAGLSDKYSGGNNAGNVAIYKRGRPAAIGSRAPNALGLYDMSGNAAEWCSDGITGYVHLRIAKGGSYRSKAASEVSLDVVEKADHQTRYDHIGFRIAWDNKP
ncbi:MAG: SUMF1/EgtB/PvdO family nonheme iron enzyme [Chitinophagaceae bacterium]|nr:SUMF1/EgtB/PvdO family nonheme iron enzyme [Chitinophagaceae bacterium]